MSCAGRVARPRRKRSPACNRSTVSGWEGAVDANWCSNSTVRLSICLQHCARRMDKTCDDHLPLLQLTARARAGGHALSSKMNSDHHVSTPPGTSA
eukprot:10303340-Alexandrium_andersonii.AAC.2